MNTLYWLTRFDSIRNFSVSLIVFCVLAIVICILVFPDANSDFRNYYEDTPKQKKIRIKEIENRKSKCKLIFKLFIPTLILSIMCNIFIPTTKEAYIIYGIGGTIDYLQQNKDAKQLPDKCVKALNCFLDKEINDSTKTKEGGEK